MTVYLEDFEEIVSKLEVDVQVRETFLNGLREVDSSCSEFICDNKYSNSLYFENDFLLEKLLGRELKDWVDWYLYDIRTFASDYNATVNDVQYNVTDLKSFIDFAKHALQLPIKQLLESAVLEVYEKEQIVHELIDRGAIVLDRVESIH
jgi:hypothetical protein